MNEAILENGIYLIVGTANGSNSFNFFKSIGTQILPEKNANRMQEDTNLIEYLINIEYVVSEKKAIKNVMLIAKILKKYHRG